MIGTTHPTTHATTHPASSTMQVKEMQVKQVWLATHPVDMRKSFDSLAEVVRSFLGHDPLSGSLFVFPSRSGRHLKILWWDHNGLVIYYKRLEKGTFSWPARQMPDQKSIALSSTQLMQLLAGCQIRS